MLLSIASVVWLCVGAMSGRSSICFLIFCHISLILMEWGEVFLLVPDRLGVVSSNGSSGRNSWPSLVMNCRIVSATSVRPMFLKAPTSLEALEEFPSSATTLRISSAPPTRDKQVRALTEFLLKYVGVQKTKASAKG